MIFTIYTADMELWLKESTLANFADDTTTDSKGNDAAQITRGWEQPATHNLGLTTCKYI